MEQEIKEIELEQNPSNPAKEEVTPAYHVIAPNKKKRKELMKKMEQQCELPKSSSKRSSRVKELTPEEEEDKNGTTELLPDGRTADDNVHPGYQMIAPIRNGERTTAKQQQNCPQHERSHGQVGG